MQQTNFATSCISTVCQGINCCIENSSFSNTPLCNTASSILSDPNTHQTIATTIGSIYGTAKSIVMPFFKFIGDWFISHKEILMQITGYSLTGIGITVSAVDIGYIVYKTIPKAINWLLRQFDGRSVEEIYVEGYNSGIKAERERFKKLIEEKLKNENEEEERKQIQKEYNEAMNNSQSQEEKDLALKNCIEQTARIKYSKEALKQFYNDIFVDENQ